MSVDEMKAEVGVEVATVDIFRVEDEEGRGVYTSDLGYRAGIVGVACQGHPLPHDDGLYRVVGSEYFGFASVEQLGQWFRPYLSELEAAGGVITVYTVPADAARHGGRQSVFLREQTLSKRPMTWQEFRSAIPSDFEQGRMDRQEVNPALTAELFMRARYGMGEHLSEEWYRGWLAADAEQLEESLKSLKDT
ncbi:hypothetical protein [Pseudomonas phage pPA-3099-2aT.2]|uniref:Uncharacterized protein n=1 Tax=Pseudomonas phage pPA-3099-2aT.2 TaxID=3003808 RepID=A0AAE9W6L1_9CAUD|nr:hypothetical protein QE325_gp128 [Pseudomonas phage pPA-3099-2aT.2]WBQ35253.1 hypothetical protein [Pseudomonas phage pPA-3099-2aT.2]